MKSRLWIVGLMLACSCTTNRIIDKPIVFDQERKDLTIEYLSEHYGIEQTSPEITPKMVVVHWTDILTLDKSFDAFYASKLPNWRPDIKKASALNVSSQFLVDRDGSIYRLMPENYMARHVIGLNHCAIGIENVGDGDEKPLTPEQLEANIWLVRYLSEKYPIAYVIGHYEYTLFEDHEWWLEKDPGYRTKKTDPGKEFIDSIRSSVKELNLKQVPVRVESDSL